MHAANLCDSNCVDMLHAHCSCMTLMWRCHLQVTAGDEYEQYDWRHMAESETLLKKLTMDKLKVYLKYHKLTTSGVKAELVERVKQHALGG